MKFDIKRGDTFDNSAVDYETYRSLSVAAQ